MMFLMRVFLVALLSLLAVGAAYPQDAVEENKHAIPLGKGLEYDVEFQSTVSDGRTPLWLNANRYGLSSLERSNGYLMAGVKRPLRTDSSRRWGMGYCVDLVLPYDFTSKFIVQQAYVEARWLSGVLSVGSKEYPMELKNNRLSSGSQTFGINARPVPQVRLALPEYWAVPLTNGWLHLKGHLAYGKMTDDGWQHKFTGRKTKYADDVLYHSKAGYLKIGKDGSSPLSVELGLEMATTFGGTSYVPDGKGGMQVYDNGSGLRSFWNAFWPGGADASEEVYKNVEGNQLGSWLLRLNWDADTWRLSVYADKYFEDHSAMFLLDYDGYGGGDEWQVKKDDRWLLYDLKDMMLGVELNLKRCRWVSNVVMEYIYSKYQSGPIYHDHTSTVPDHIGGKDNYYNHSLFTGWQHWGQVMGNPLYRSPIYNDEGTISVKNNRFMALHLGVDGRPFKGFAYRMLASLQDGLGTYDEPYGCRRRNFSFLIEGGYTFGGKTLSGWSLNCGYAMDFGSILGDNCGFQLTVTKTGLFGFN